MPEKTKDEIRAEACAKALSHVQKALRSDSENEALSSLKHARRLVKKHDLFDLLTPPPRASQGIDIASAAAAVEKLKDAANTVKAVAADGDVQTLVKGLGDLFRAGSNIVDKARKRR